MFDTLMHNIASCPLAHLFVLLVILDSVLGLLRAIKFRKFNSTFGIDGGIRKCAMILSIVFLNVVDTLFSFNLINYVPKEVAQFLAIETVGVAELFALIFILCEAVSLLKNMLLCGVPIPVRIYTKVASLLDKWTDELNDFELVHSIDDNGRERVIVGEKKKRE